MILDSCTDDTLQAQHLMNRNTELAHVSKKNVTAPRLWLVEVQFQSRKIMSPEVRRQTRDQRGRISLRLRTAVLYH
jgi:hypothetical protein